MITIMIRPYLQFISCFIVLPQFPSTLPIARPPLACIGRHISACVSAQHTLTTRIILNHGLYLLYPKSRPRKKQTCLSKLYKKQKHLSRRCNTTNSRAQHTCNCLETFARFHPPSSRANLYDDEIPIARLTKRQSHLQQTHSQPFSTASPRVQTSISYHPLSRYSGPLLLSTVLKYKSYLLQPDPIC